ncbi:hypothetical protein EDC02_0971 [Micromonospora sp. Llam0]|nr:hypothetical protein EDC02_0971 [Micromonospora sp. Llam0]
MMWHQVLRGGTIGWPQYGVAGLAAMLGLTR